VLEIGCGNGFTASLLSAKAEHVIALDLPFENLATHSVGISQASELIDRVGIKNVDIIGGSAEALPFPDESFDIIFSAYVLNYVRGRDKALAEIRRVLDDKGVAITLVPNFTERIFAPFIKYEYLAKQALSYMTGWKKRPCRSDAAFSGALAHKSGGGLVDWLLMKPDGPYKSSMQELWRHRPSVWRRIFETNGFRIVNIFSVQLLPVGLFDLLGPCGVRLVSKVLFNLNQMVGGSAMAKRMGYSLGIVAMKS
jgi:SAM-dependent methyltransferase